MSSRLFKMLFCEFRPFRPRPPPDQSADDQKPPAPEDTKDQGEVKQVEASEGPQTNGETAEGQGQKPRRPSRRRRQRQSESSTSKASVFFLFFFPPIVFGWWIKVMFSELLLKYDQLIQCRISVWNKWMLMFPFSQLQSLTKLSWTKPWIGLWAP